MIPQQPAASSQQPAASSQQRGQLAAALIDALSDDEWRKEFERMANELHAQFPHLSLDDARDVLDKAIEPLIFKNVRFSDLSECCASAFTRARHLLQHVQRTHDHRASLESIRELNAEDGGVLTFEARDEKEAALNLVSKEDRDLLIEVFENDVSVAGYAKGKNDSAERLKTRKRRAVKKIRDEKNNLE